MSRTFLLLTTAIILSAASPLASTLQQSHRALTAALRQNHVLVPGRRLLRVAYVCSVKLGRQTDPIVEILEQVPAAMEPRGVSRILLLSPDLKPLWQADASQARPLFCQANTLYVAGKIRDPDGTTGNKISFLFGGQAATITQINPLKLPAPIEHP